MCLFSYSQRGRTREREREGEKEKGGRGRDMYPSSAHKWQEDQPGRLLFLFFFSRFWLACAIWQRGLKWNGNKGQRGFSDNRSRNHVYLYIERGVVTALYVDAIKGNDSNYVTSHTHTFLHFISGSPQMNAIFEQKQGGGIVYFPPENLAEYLDSSLVTPVSGGASSPQQQQCGGSSRRKHRTFFDEVP